YPDANALFDPVRGREVYAQHLDQMAMCEEYGFDAICMNEHHSKPYGLMPSPNIVAAALTQRTRRIKIGILGNLPALHGHPVRLAEEIAMLDCMSDGRIVSGFVRGVPQEYLALSLPLDEARERLAEAWDLIIKAWTAREPFEWRGKDLSYDRVSMWARARSSSPTRRSSCPPTAKRGSKRRRDVGCPLASPIAPSLGPRPSSRLTAGSPRATAGRRGPSTVWFCATSTWPRPMLRPAPR